MVKRKDKEQPMLLITRKEAGEKIIVQIEKGKKILNINIASDNDLNKANSDYDRWDDYNTELLSRIFSNTSFVDQYNYRGFSQGMINPSLPWLISSFRERVQETINRLKSVNNRLELVPEDFSVVGDSEIESEIKSSDVFIVHGHDEKIKVIVAGFIKTLGLNPIILHEKPNANRTVIEKFEDYSDVGFAVVILSPDDIGYTNDKLESKNYRARQNVIFEMGYFIGKLGRNRVCVLHVENVELPSDYSGILYTPIDSGENWKIDLAKEIKHAGIDIDLNRLIG